MRSAVAIGGSSGTSTICDWARLAATRCEREKANLLTNGKLSLSCAATHHCATAQGALKGRYSECPISNSPNESHNFTFEVLPRLTQLVGSW